MLLNHLNLKGNLVNLNHILAASGFKTRSSYFPPISYKTKINQPTFVSSFQAFVSILLSTTPCGSRPVLAMSSIARRALAVIFRTSN